MCLRPRPVGPVPEETARVARVAFPEGNVYMIARYFVETEELVPDACNVYNELALPDGLYEDVQEYREERA